MKIYVICAVRNGVPERIADLRVYAAMRRTAGHVVHFPPDDALQDDPTGIAICEAHRNAMIECDEVHVFWDVRSFGSHFDLGMAFALRKKIVPIACEVLDGPGKSYWKVINARPSDAA